jgi:hypothetical protein
MMVCECRLHNGGARGRHVLRWCLLRRARLAVTHGTHTLVWAPPPPPPPPTHPSLGTLRSPCSP